MAYELIIKNQVGSIQWDPNGLQQYVEGMIQKYDGLIFTDEEIPEAKKRMADLNRLKKNIEDKRKEIKKEIAEPYMQFEAQIKPSRIARHTRSSSTETTPNGSGEDPEESEDPTQLQQLAGARGAPTTSCG